MPHRENKLASLTTSAVAAPRAAAGQQLTPGHHPVDTQCCTPPGAANDYFPNLPVVTHEGQRALFFNDLLRGRLVLVNFMSVRHDGSYPVTGNLARVQRLLGERVGRDVFMYSITVDPEHDTPQVLREFANQKGVKPGWLLLTGEPRTIELIKGRFFVSRGAGGHGHHDQDGKPHDCSMGLARYGNVSVGLWGSVAAKADPAQIAERLSWITPRAKPSGPPRRRGPAPRVLRFSEPSRQEDS